MTIRMATEDDAAAIAEIYAPAVTEAVTSFELEPPDAAEMARRMAAVVGHAPWLVMEDGGEVAGYAYAGKHRERAAYAWSVDASVYVRAGRRRGGVGRRLYEVLFELLRLQGFYTVHAGITLPNPASVGLHEAMGLALIGVYPSVGFKFGGWHDVGWWGMALRPRTGEPAPPLTVAEASALPAWRERLSGA